MKLLTLITKHHDRTDMAVLGSLLMGDIYMNDIWRRIGGGAGGVIVSLIHLEQQGHIWSAPAEQPDGHTRRRYGVTRATLDRVAWESR